MSLLQYKYIEIKRVLPFANFPPPLWQEFKCMQLSLFLSFRTKSFKNLPNGNFTAVERHLGVFWVSLHVGLHWSTWELVSNTKGSSAPSAGIFLPEALEALLKEQTVALTQFPQGAAFIWSLSHLFIWLALCSLVSCPMALHPSPWHTGQERVAVQGTSAVSTRYFIGQPHQGCF